VVRCGSWAAEAALCSRHGLDLWLARAGEAGGIPNRSAQVWHGLDSGRPRLPDRRKVPSVSVAGGASAMKG